MDDFSRIVPNVHFEKIPIKNLVSNQEYQRILSLAHIRKLYEKSQKEKLSTDEPDDLDLFSGSQIEREAEKYDYDSDNREALAYN